MNKLTAVITLGMIAIAILGTATMIETKSVQADSKQADSKQAILSTQKVKSTQISQALMIVDPFITAANQNTNTQTLQTTQAQTSQTQTSNPLLDEEEFDITVTNIKNSDIKVSITIDGLKNSTIIPGNPPNITLPTTKVVVFKFDRHENAGTTGVLPIKLGDEYTPCIAFSNNEDKASCLRASIDSITQPQKKALDANYIPF